MKRFRWFVEFRDSLKSPWAEEAIDLVFYRPLAFLFVKLLLRLPVTPNQISLGAMAAGIAGGVFFAGGDRSGFVLGALLYGLSNVLDCCDGMIARLKKNGTPTGRIVDGLVDYVTAVAVYAGFGVGLSKAALCGTLHLPYGCNAWILMIAAGASFAAHAMLSDKYRNMFIEQLRRAGEPAEDEIAKFTAELGRLRALQRRGFDTLLIRIYLKYLRMQGRVHPAALTNPTRISAATVVLWNCIGPSTHISFLITAAIFFKPALFFIYVIGAANVWMISLFLLQLRQRHPISN